MLMMRCHVLKFVESSGFPIVGAVMGSTTPLPPPSYNFFRKHPHQNQYLPWDTHYLKHEAPPPSPPHPLKHEEPFHEMIRRKAQ